MNNEDEKPFYKVWVVDMFDCYGPDSGGEIKRFADINEAIAFARQKFITDNGNREDMSGWANGASNFLVYDSNGKLVFSAGDEWDENKNVKNITI